ncbi:MAG: retron system putative HNH endonuclease, partial [bacterium]
MKLLAAVTEKEQKKVDKKYRHQQIKETLKIMFHGKCAYCESKITHIDYGQIDHFKPKSKYPELTFEWTNLLLACGICNGPVYKGNSFPEAEEGGPLVNPCSDDPIENFEFFYDVHTQIESVYGVTKRG